MRGVSHFTGKKYNNAAKFADHGSHHAKILYDKTAIRPYCALRQQWIFFWRSEEIVSLALRFLAYVTCPFVKRNLK